MNITRPPADPSAGIVAVIPDGGLLPKPQFKVEVFNDRGKQLKHEFLWHNPKEGLAVVFEPTEGDTVFIYVSPSREKMSFARPGGATSPAPRSAIALRDGEPAKPGSADAVRVSAFHPGLLLYVRNGNAGLDQAHTMADKPPVGDDIYFTVVDSIFHSLSPVGRDDNSSSYYTGWFNAQKPGKTYFYTSSKDGSEFFIDGKLAYSWPGVHRRDSYAQKGQWIDLAPGPHRVEYFHFNVAFPGREAHLGWQQAGERQVDDPKVKGRKNLDVTGPMQPDDFIHSGRVELQRAFSKNGPLAIFYPVWASIIQPGKYPVCLFRFEPFGAEVLPGSAVCSWDFGNQRVVKGRSVFWLYGGQDDQTVALTLTVGGHNSRAVRCFFPKSLDPGKEPPRVSVFTPEGRAEYRAVYQAMVSTAPKEKRPCEDWNETMWEGFAAVLDQQTESALLSDIVERSSPDMKRAGAELCRKIENRIIEIVRCSDPKKAFALVELLEKEEKDDQRIAHWKAKKIEFTLYELNDPGLARRYAGQFAARHTDKYSSTLSLVRMGDVERFDNNFEAARRLYTKARDLYAGSVSSNQPAPAASGQVSATRASSASPGSAGAKAGSARATERGARPDTASRKSKELSSGTNVKSSVKAGVTAPARSLPVSRSNLLAQSISDWKVTAVQEAGYYATVQSFIDQDAYEEARATLDQWELEFPLAKLTGDYLLAEALYYVVLNNYRAAGRILANYRRAVEISNELPKAMRMELYCLTKTQNDKEARAFARAIIERLPRHALADELRILLAEDDSKPLVIDFDVHSRAWTASEKVKSSSLGKLFDDKVTVIQVESEENTGNE